MLASKLMSKLDKPWIPGVIAGLTGLIFVLCRLAVAAGGNVASFVIAGNRYSNPRLVPRGLPVGQGNGYDGQFYYRMALDPGDLNSTAFGIHLDSAARLGRIGYPLLAWLAALGRVSAVPTSLVAVNVVGLAILGVAGGLLAAQLGRHALWGLLFPGYWGYLWTLSRDLTEITAAAFLLLGLVGYRSKHYLLAGIAFSIGVLSKETVVIPVAILGLMRLGEILGIFGRHRSGSDKQPIVDKPVVGKFGATDLSWILPGITFCSWQLVVLLAIGRIPLLSSSGHNLGIPFVGLTTAFWHYLTNIPATSALLWCAEFVVLAFISYSAASLWRSGKATTHERIAWIAFVVLVVSLASGIWFGAVGFRSLDDLYLFGCIVLLGATPRRRFERLLVAVVGTTWIVVAVELILFR